MHCPLEDKPTMRDHLMCFIIWLLTYIGACVALTVISFLMGNPVSLKALIFIYLAIGVSNLIPKITAKWRNSYFWSRWEKKQMSR
jgi:hypothetical protein